MKAKLEKSNKEKESLRKEILESMLASFKIEGIIITSEYAKKALKKVELSLEK